MSTTTMREIRFRTWIPEAIHPLTETGMFYQDNQYLYSFLRRIYQQFQLAHPAGMPFQTEERLMQFTGLLDKNGVEIYEKDIVRLYLLGWVESYHKNYVVTWRDFQWYFDSTEEDDGAAEISLDKKWTPQSEVIGNIYQNPELIKGTKKGGK